MDFMRESGKDLKGTEQLVIPFRQKIRPGRMKKQTTRPAKKALIYSNANKSVLL
jgi:hypothetical protein